MTKMCLSALSGLFLTLALLNPSPAREIKPETEEATGTLVQRRGPWDGRWDAAPLPLWKLVADGKTHWLQIDDAQLLARAGRLEDRRVRVTGHFEDRRFGLGLLPPANGGSVPEIARLVNLRVFVVETLAPVERNPEKREIEIRTKVYYVGNSYSRLPNGMVVGTCVAYPYEGCYIVIDCEQINLDFQPPLELVDQQTLRGQTLILKGHYTRRCGALGLPDQQVFVVTGYHAAL
jgi:hypothetical protein